MKTIATALATAGVLAGLSWANGAPVKPIHRSIPKPSVVDIVSCAPRADGFDGFFCAETKPGSRKAVATILFVKTGDKLFGVRQATK